MDMGRMSLRARSQHLCSSEIAVVLHDLLQLGMTARYRAAVNGVDVKRDADVVP